MITIEPPYYLVKGTTVLRDHQDPDQFYFLPGRVVLAPRPDDPGAPSFTLYKYRTDLAGAAGGAPDPTRAAGGGLCLFETELAGPSLTALTTEVAAQSGRPNARLAPVMFRGAEVHAMVAHVDGDHLIDDLVETHGAPLAPPYHAAFTLGLTPAGAALVEQAARGGGIPVGVAYQLRFLALTQALHAHITMDYDQAWDRFSASLGFTYVVKAQLDLEMAWLVEHDLLRIEITSFTDAEDAARQQREAMALVTARVQGDFFRSAVPPDGDDASAPPGPVGQMVGNAVGSKVTSASAYFVLKAKYEAVKETKTFDLTWNGRAAIELVHVAAGSLATMMKTRGDGAPPPDVRAIDASDPFFATLDVRVIGACDFDAQPDLREAVVNVSRGDRREAFVFSRASLGPFRFQWPLPSALDDAYQVDVRYGFDADRGQGPSTIAAGPFTTKDRALVVNPLDHVRIRAVRFVLGPVDVARVPRIHVAARVPGPAGQDDVAREAFALDAATGEHVFRLHVPVTAPGAPIDPLLVRFRTQWEDPSGALHDGDDGVADGDTVVVLGPYRDLLELLVVPACSFDAVTELLVTVRYEDGDDVFERVLTFDASGKGASQRLAIPLLDPKKRAYRYRVATFRSDGTKDDGAWADADAPVLVASGEKKTTAPLQVVWVGAAGDALGIRVDAWATGADGVERQASAFLRAGDAAPKTLDLPLDGDGKLAYRYEVRAETAAGEALVRKGDGAAPLLVVQLPPPGS